MWLIVVLSFALLTTSSSRPPLRETVEVNGRLYHEVSPESHRMLLSLNESELDPRHVFIDQHGRRLATHLKFSPSELESEMVCTQQPWSEAHSLPGWCPQARYPGKYKPCPQCFIENWCSTNAPWYGITCNGPMMTGRIIRLEFESNEPIGGEIYSNFPFFTDIEKIGLLSNGLSGGIPGNLGGCAGLTHMSLDKNQLSGDVPGSLGGLGALTYLNVGNNQLSGGISEELGGMSAIVRLYFNNNQFTGPIPASIGGLAHLSYVTFAHNQLSGQVPESLCQLQKTTMIKVWFNEGLTCYPQCMANGRIGTFIKDNNPHAAGADAQGKVLCCCADCSYVEVTQNERNYCSPTWPTAAPVHMPTMEDAAPSVWGPGGPGTHLPPDANTDSASSSDASTSASASVRLEKIPLVTKQQLHGLLRGRPPKGKFSFEQQDEQQDEQNEQNEQNEREQQRRAEFHAFG